MATQTVERRVAHDLNNLLTVIAAYGQLVLDGLSADDPARADQQEILVAAQQAVALIRHLSASSPRESVRPQAVNSSVVDSVPETLHGNETVLLFEADPAAGDRTHGILEGSGYHVLRADSREAVERQVASHDGPIDILLADVTRGVGVGTQLAGCARRWHPRIRVVFISGQNQPAQTPHAAVSGAWSLQKPFSAHGLARVLRAALAAAPGRTMPLGSLLRSPRRVHEHVVIRQPLHAVRKQPANPMW